VNEGEQSLAKILIGNRLAESVFASSEDVDARDVPMLLKELFQESMSLGEALKKRDYIQIIFALPIRTFFSIPDNSLNADQPPS